MAEESPSVVILAGPNGAGKTTSAPFVLRDVLGLQEFVNADDIARGLSGFAPDRAAFAAGRIMLTRIHELAHSRATFAFETTLSTRTYAPWLRCLRGTGYRVCLVFLHLPSPDFAVDRVRERVREGGHDVPEPTVRRRYRRGLHNLFELYMPLADAWTVYDNSGSTPKRIAQGRESQPSRITQCELRKILCEGCADG